MNIPNGNVWMSEMELGKLLSVIDVTLRTAIKRYTRVEHFTLQLLLNNAMLSPLQVGLHFYNLEEVITLAFRLNTYEEQDKAKVVGKFKPA